jgi:hypothetical protein
MLAAAEAAANMKLLPIAFIVGMTVSSATAAPGVQLSIGNGRVWIVTNGATVGQILAEWERVGGTRIINGDHVAGGPLTLEMRGVPELEALDVVLRSASGFIAADRTLDGTALQPNRSRFERIVVLPESARPADPALRAVAQPPTSPPRALEPPAPIITASGGQRLIGPDGQPVPDDQDGAPPPPLPSPPRRP